MNTVRAAIVNDSPFCKSRQDMKKLEDALSDDAAMHARALVARVAARA